MLVMPSIQVCRRPVTCWSTFCSIFSSFYKAPCPRVASEFVRFHLRHPFPLSAPPPLSLFFSPPSPLRKVNSENSSLADAFPAWVSFAPPTASSLATTILHRVLSAFAFTVHPYKPRVDEAHDGCFSPFLTIFWCPSLRVLQKAGGCKRGLLGDPRD